MGSKIFKVTPKAKAPPLGEGEDVFGDDVPQIEAPASRYIRAATAGKALKHAQKAEFEVVVATQDELFTAGAAGVSVEDAGE